MMPSNSSSGIRFPDPILTANLYCEGRLDELVYGVVAPAWRELRQHDPDRAGYLWLVRYAKGGEHLKVRLHGPAELRAGMELLLSEAAEIFFRKLGPPVPDSARKDRLGVPPIDPEDRVEGGHADRSLLWTTYQRSHVSLGGQPFLGDDRYAALLTASLGEACENVLAALQPAEDGAVPARLRQTTLLKGLISGLAGLDFQDGQHASYLGYHRDWLVRYQLLQGGGSPGKETEVLAHFDDQAGKMGPTLERLRHVASTEWNGDGGNAGSWRHSLASLAGYVAGFREDPAYHVDPYAPGPVFPALFKALHGFANQLGLNMMDEAFTHHLLLRAVLPSGAASELAAVAGEGAR